MARASHPLRPNQSRSLSRRLSLLLACCALLLAAAGCGGDGSVFTSSTAGSADGTTTSTPGGSVQTTQPGTTGEGRNPGASAQAVPAGAQAYAGLDLSALPALVGLVEVFASADPTSLTEGLDLGLGAGDALEGAGEARDALSCLRDELDLESGTLPDWVGGEAAFALYNMEFDADGDVGEPDVLAMVEVSDQAAAAAFLQTAITALEDCTETTFGEAAYQGVTVYRAEPDEETPPVAVALTQSHLILAMGEGMVERAIDLPGGRLADDPSFTEVVAALPTGRHLTGYMGVDLLQQAMEGFGAGLAESDGLPLPPGLDPTQALAGLRGLGMAGTLLADGMRVDLIALGQPAGGLPTPELSASSLPGLLPDDAIGFAGIGPFDVGAAWDGLLDLLAQMPVEPGDPTVTDIIGEVGTMLGIDIEQDLIGQLTGQFGIGLLPATAGTLVDQAGVNLGLIAALGVRNPGAMGDTVARMADGIAMLSGMPAAPRPFDGGTLYGLSDESADILLFGMAGDHLVLTTHQSHAAALVAGGPKLAGSDRYAQAVGGLPQGSTPLLYLDVAALVAALGLGEDQAAAVAPLRSVAMSVAMGDGIAKIIVFAGLDY